MKKLNLTLAGFLYSVFLLLFYTALIWLAWNTVIRDVFIAPPIDYLQMTIILASIKLVKEL